MRFRRLAWGVLGVNLFVILWGAFVRASGSGAGCGRHWPLCNGQVLPRGRTAAMWIELTHRTTSGVALLLVGLLVWASRKEFPRGHLTRRFAALSLGFVIAEALIGAGLVLLALVGPNDSLARAGYLSVHLLNTFLLLGSLALTIHFAGYRPAAQFRSTGGGVVWLWIAGLALLLVTGMSGAIAALGDTLFPAGSLAEGLRADRSPGAHFLLRLRVMHPVAALVVAGYVIGMVWGIIRLSTGASGVRARAVLGLVLLQLTVGAGNLLLLAPTALQLGHLFVADLLWIAVVLFGAGVVWTEGVAARDPKSALHVPDHRIGELAGAE